MRRFGQRANDSVSGAVDRRPWLFISWKSGDSLSLRRIHTDTASSSSDTPNGMRHPQSSKRSVPSQSRQPRITSRERNRPSVAVVWIHEVYAPRLPCGACSATYVAAPPYSPPSARPCNRRRRMRMTGAAMPMRA
jgi:hypothetical protein